MNPFCFPLFEFFFFFLWKKRIFFWNDKKKRASQLYRPAPREGIQQTSWLPYPKSPTMKILHSPPVYFTPSPPPRKLHHQSSYSPLGGRDIKSLLYLGFGSLQERISTMEFPFLNIDNIILSRNHEKKEELIYNSLNCSVSLSLSS